MGSHHKKETIEKLETRKVTWGNKVSETLRKRYEEHPELGQKTARYMLEWAEVHGNAFLGKHHSLETKMKLSASKKDKRLSMEQRAKIGESLRRKYSDPIYREKQVEIVRRTFLGKPHNEQTRLRQSLGVKKKWQEPKHHASKSGANHHNWQGGISFEPYGEDFSHELKSLMRMRDDYACQSCHREERADYSLDIHHIDYDKTNNAFMNLITVCRACNAKLNFDREYWSKHFEFEMLIKVLGEID